MSPEREAYGHLSEVGGMRLVDCLKSHSLDYPKEMERLVHRERRPCCSNKEVLK